MNTKIIPHPSSRYPEAEEMAARREKQQRAHTVNGLLFRLERQGKLSNGTLAYIAQESQLFLSDCNEGEQRPQPIAHPCPNMERPRRKLPSDYGQRDLRSPEEKLTPLDVSFLIALGVASVLSVVWLLRWISDHFPHPHF